MSRNRRWIGFSLGLFLAFVLWGCNAAPLTPANELPTLTAPMESAQDTPAAVPGLQQYTSQDFGFSLSYPAGFEVQQSFPHSVVFLAPPGTAGHRERGFLTVELTLDENAEWYANQAMEQNAGLGLEITSSMQMLDGQQAYILSGLTGQDPNRQVFIVNNEALYHLTFMPDSPAAGEDYQQMEALYTAIIGSLRFQPERQSVPPVTDILHMTHHLERALNARSAEDIAPLLGDAFVLGYLNPAMAEAVTFSRIAGTDVVPLILNDHLSEAPAVALQYQVDWASVPGSLDTYSGVIPGEDVTPILARGWGPNGADEAVILIARRIDGSLFWRGALALQ